MEKNQYNNHQTSIVDRKVSLWLFICCFFIFLMVFIGGATRLTDSGLSMTNWHPVHGIMPPMNESEWLEEFDSYRQSPEYQKVNKGMELEEFKKIFFWEYIHRIAGRVIGVVFLFPLIYFSISRRISARRTLALFFIFALGGLQGVVGWWMVKSGLINEPAVSHYRLAIHLSLALLLFALVFWQALCFRLKPDSNPKISDSETNILKKASIIALIFLIIQIIYGAFVAGKDAGLVYNSWPLMDGDFIPVGFLPDGLASAFNDIISIQFIHRWFAFIVFFAVLFLFVKTKKSLKRIGKDNWGVTETRLKKSVNMLFSIVILQIVLGIKTLILNVPISIALVHQLMAVILLGNLIFIIKTMYLSSSGK